MNVLCTSLDSDSLKRDRKKQKGKKKKDFILAFLTMRCSWVTADVDGSWEHFSSPEQALVRNSDEWFLIHVPKKSKRMNETVLSFVKGIACMFVCLYDWMSACLNFRLYDCLSICLFVSLSVCVSICKSINVSDCVWLSVYLPICKSICLSVDL